MMYPHLGYTIATFPQKMKENECIKLIELINNMITDVRNLKTKVVSEYRPEEYRPEDVEVFFDFERELKSKDVPSNSQVASKYAKYRQAMDNDIWLGNQLLLFLFNHICWMIELEIH